MTGAEIRAVADRSVGDIDVPWLRGFFAPVQDELDVSGPAVEGELPDGLRGAYLRNGPNPRFAPLGRSHLFDGDGMVHAVTFDGEGGAAYANRWVRTAGFEAEEAAGHALFGGLSELRLPPAEVMAAVGPVKNTANTHVVRHAGRILALNEGFGPIEIDADLRTLGPVDFDGALVGAMTAHPKVDPTTGELVFFGYSPVAPFLRVHSADAHGRLTWSTEVELGGPVMMHDVAVTATRVVLFDLPAVFDLRALLRGDPGISWVPERGARIGLLDRGAPGDTVRWIEVEPFWMFHVLNAHDEADGSVVVTGCRAERLNTSFDGGSVSHGFEPFLHRWRIGPGASSFVGEQLDDRPTDFPRLDDRRAGLDHRYGYTAHAASWASADEVAFDGVTRHDLHTATSITRRFGTAVRCGETVFAADPGRVDEDAGWLLSFVHDLEAEQSSVVVLDAATLDEAARVLLPRRVPFGFHGSFLPSF